MVWTKGDISGLLHDWKAGALTPKQAAGWAFALLRNVFAPNHLTFSVTDPVPSFWIYLQAPLKKLGIAPGSKRLSRARSSRLHALEPWPTSGAA